MPCNNRLVRRGAYNNWHCYRCDVCVHRLHHHCKWVGKCIGRGNRLEFVLFLRLTFGGLLYSLGLQVVAVL